MYWYKNKNYPDYLKEGNACQYVAPIAKKFCVGHGLDIGCGKWRLEGATPIDTSFRNRSDPFGVYNANNLPQRKYDYIFSSHCLEHLGDPIDALEHWKTRLEVDGVLFLYLPHPDMEYWLPQNCRKHLHSWQPEEMANILETLGFKDVIYSGRDLAWGFSVVGFNKKNAVTISG